MSTQEIKLESLVGLHQFPGWDEDQTELFSLGWGYGSNCLRFTLDGQTYCAIEDPDDSYRSSLDKVILVETPCKNSVANLAVLGRMVEGEEILELVRCDNISKVVLRVGTDNSDSYYPWFEATIIKENL